MNITISTESSAVNHINAIQVWESMDAFVSCDYHIGKWMLKSGKEADHYKALETQCVRLHNLTIKKDDYFVFLGDLGEEEFESDNNKYAKYLKKVVEGLNGKKIMIRGNNDSLSNKFYESCGFEKIINRDMLITGKYIYSHFPANVHDKKLLNLFGHIHGAGFVYELSPKNRIDCYWMLWGGPKRISELDKLYHSGAYKCTTTEMPTVDGNMDSINYVKGGMVKPGMNSPDPHV